MFRAAELKIIKTATPIVILLVIISGCTYSPGALPFNAHSGTEALRISFMKNSPPDIVYAGTEFPVGIMLENAGAVALDGVLIINAPEFPTEKMIKNDDFFRFKIPGREDTRTFIGGRSFKIFMLSAPEELGLNEINTEITATACYPYYTIATTSFCVDTSIYEGGRKPCTFREKTTLSSQGAPIVISEIDAAKLFQSESEVKMVFTIKIRNVGDGIVVDKGKWEVLCSNTKVTGAPSAYFGRAYVSAKLGDKELNCGKRNYADLSQNSEDIVTCETGILKVSDGSYVSPLLINVSYGYVQIATKEVIIKKLPG